MDYHCSDWGQAACFCEVVHIVSASITIGEFLIWVMT